MEKLSEKEMYVRHKVLSREIRENLALYLETTQDFKPEKFVKEVNKNRPSNVADDSNIGRAYSLVFDAIGYLNRRMDFPGLELIEKVLELDPQNEEALNIKMDMMAHAFNHEQAEECADKIIALKTANPHLYANSYFTKSSIRIAKACESHDRSLFVKALEFNQEGLEICQDNYDLTMQRAGILYQLGRRDYTKWIEKARKIDKRRTELFMEHYWIEEKLI